MFTSQHVPGKPREADDSSSVENMSASELRQRTGQLEKSLRLLEERLASHERVFYDNPIPTLVYSTKDLYILNANESALALYGMNLQEMRERTMLDLFANDPGSPGRDYAHELRRPFSSIGGAVQRGAQGQELVVSLVSITFEFRGVDARISIIEDQTERHNTEEALRTSEERFRELFENANDVIFLHDLKGKILEVNRAAEHLTGYSRTEVLGRDIEGLVTPEARELVLDIVRAHLGGSAPHHYELPVVSKGGKIRYLEVSTRMIYRRGHPVAIQGIGRDVTERKSAQQKLLESSREMQQKNVELSNALHLAHESTRLKEQFLANTSHELRTPMNGIMGMIDLLKTTELTSEQLEYAEVVKQCANDLLTIINDLLDLSQMEARRFHLIVEPFDAYESLRSVIKLLKVRADNKNLALTCDFDSGLPRLIYGDSVRFRQLLTNLIANAVKFTPAGSVRVRLRLAETSDRIRCEVIDSGIGVEESIQERVFEAFFQADGTTRRRFGGNGLGLAICQQLVGNMGGEIGLFNNQDAPGATFWFELPLHPADGEALPVDTGEPDGLPEQEGDGATGNCC